VDYINCCGVSAIVGGLFPLLVSIGLPKEFTIVGFLFFGVTAACVSLEKLLCFTTTWRRCVIAAFDIDSTLALLIQFNSAKVFNLLIIHSFNFYIACM
jgi:hypothetical protein